MLRLLGIRPTYQFVRPGTANPHPTLPLQAREGMRARNLVGGLLTQYKIVGIQSPQSAAPTAPLTKGSHVSPNKVKVSERMPSLTCKGGVGEGYAAGTEGYVQTEARR